MDEVEQIKNRLDIVEVIGSYIELKKAGRNYRAFSPFHQEKNPSFMISPEKNIWHDFSTDEGGDIFTFVMKMEGITFVEALEMLAKKAGVNLKPRSKLDSNSNSKKMRLYQANDLAMKYYQVTLSKNKRAIEYLIKERGLKKPIIQDFCIGYAPDSWEALANFMSKRGYSAQELKLAGLAGQKSDGKTFDTFRKRVIFPIFDNLGRCVGFSARILDGDEKSAKYINTAQTPIYNKSLAIFGLYQAKQTIRDLDEIIVVEGNMDVIGLANAGQKNAVAISGTALTREQLIILSRLSNNIKLCFDNDEAGVKATIRAIELASESNTKLMIIDLSQAKDPDELIKKNKKLWEKLRNNAKYAVDFLFDFAMRNNDLKSASGKKNYSDFLLPIVRSLSDEVEKDHYIKLLSEKINVSYDAVKRKMNSPKMIKKVIHRKEQEEKITIKNVKESKNQIVEENILKLFLAFPSCREAMVDIDLADISERNKPIFEQLSKKPDISLDDLSKVLKDRGNYAKITALKGEEEFASETNQDLKLEAFAQVHRLHQLNLENKKKILLEEISITEKKGQKTLAKKLLSKYQDLIDKE